jgi:rare lipoprotein A
MLAVRTLAVAVICFALSPALANPGAHAAKSKPKPADRIVASVYWQGKRVATGRKFDPDGMTVAHRSLPFGTRLLVYYGSSAAEVVVNDRGPFVRGRDIDLSRGVAKALHFSGVGRVRVVFWPPLPLERPAGPIELSREIKDQCANAESAGCR